ncbi:type III-B CRISPR module-associated Cmr3 family protein [Actinomycetospora chiangmaiensis]|uniref:type III-B CRISPR module-associated Cmr3 family protein n=1 Tax=Actinomycetospora chiangmaiensis TaxID=402650 RepID=UPI00037DFA9F|nr:type III-B CRISPR module-associated Cmr3 family protein [Actinomycetospora chiangmaiensis]
MGQDFLHNWLDAEYVAPGAELTESDLGELRGQETLLASESRVGLLRHRDGPLQGAGQSGRLYAMAHLRPVDGLSFAVGCEADVPLAPVESVVPLGGQGRHAQVEVLTAGPELPRAPLSFPGGRVAVYLATPALLESCWWAPRGPRLCAAVLGPPQPVASLSARRGWEARSLCWAVLAGSVFYLEFGDDEAAAG